MPITVESSIRSNKEVRKTTTGKKLTKGSIPRWVKYGAIALGLYLGFKWITKDKRNAVQSADIPPPGGG